MWTHDGPGIEISSALPGTPRKMILKIPEILATKIYKDLTFYSRAYPPGLKLFKGDGISTLRLAGAFE